MKSKGIYCNWILIAAFFIAIGSAHAAQGDNEAVAKARRDYEKAVRSGDAGRINAMKIELSVQLAKAKEKKDQAIAKNGNKKHSN